MLYSRNRVKNWITSMKIRKTAYTVITFQAAFVLKVKVGAEIHLFVFVIFQIIWIYKRLSLNSGKFRGITFLSVTAWFIVFRCICLVWNIPRPVYMKKLTPVDHTGQFQIIILRQFTNKKNHLLQDSPYYQSAWVWRLQCS